MAGKGQSHSLKPASRSGEKGTWDRPAGKLREQGTEVIEGKMCYMKRNMKFPFPRRGKNI